MFNVTPVPAFVSAASSAAAGNGCVESVLCEDPATLRVAAQIESVLRRFTPARRRSAEMYFGGYPAAGSNPRGQRGVLARQTFGQRSIAAALEAAGGVDLVDAAGRLADWAGAAVKFRELRWVLLGWLPDEIVSPAASAITRRLLCDTAGLVAVNETTVVSAQAATEFAAAAMGLVDDVGLVNEPALRQIADHAGWGTSFEGLVEACGFVRICGVLSASSGRIASAKAGLVRLGYPASAAEVAAMCRRDPSGVSSGLSVCETVRKTGFKRWTLTDTEHKSVVSMWGHVDDAGLLTADTLAALAADVGWVGSVERFATLRGFVRLFGYWATAETPTAAVKAALGSLQHPATVDEIAEMTGCSVDDVIWVCRSCDTIIDAGDGCWRTCTDAGFADFVGVARDDVGLVDDVGLLAAATAGGWSDQIDKFAQIRRYQRFGGRLASRRTHQAVVKAALWALGGVAATRDIAQAAEMTNNATARALTHCSSIRFDRTSRRWMITTDDTAPQPATSPTDDTAPQPATSPTDDTAPQPATSPTDDTAPQPATSPTTTPHRSPQRRQPTTPHRSRATSPTDDTAPQPATSPTDDTHRAPWRHAARLQHRDRSELSLSGPRLLLRCGNSNVPPPSPRSPKRSAGPTKRCTRSSTPNR